MRPLSSELFSRKSYNQINLFIDDVVTITINNTNGITIGLDVTINTAQVIIQAD